MLPHCLLLAKLGLLALLNYVTSKMQLEWTNEKLLVHVNEGIAIFSTLMVYGFNSINF
jgi:hypothetical protein